MPAPPATAPYRETPSGLDLHVRLTPKAARDAVGGCIQTPQGMALQAHVRAVPENGAANQALIALIAKWLRIPKSSISLTAGGKSRLKTLSIDGGTGELINKIESALKR